MTPNDVKIVAENIDDFIEVPDGAERLRKAVLTLAVAGKLVTQNKDEGTAEDLYAEILAERSSSKKSAKEFSQVDSAEIPFDIPKTWKWVPFGSMFLDYGSGSTPSRANDEYYSVKGVNWYKSGELNDAVLPIEAVEKVSELALKECRLRIFKPKDFLIAMYGATAGRIAVSNSTGTTNQAVWSGTPVKSIDDRYLYYYILQSRQILIDKSSGAAQPNISGEKILAHSFALPPLGEQKRIVKKVEEVMKQLDELEAKKRERDETRTRLARSAMQSLGKGESKIAFDHLAELVQTPTDLKELEGALLTLAVSGKLVPQDKKDGTGEELYVQIHEEPSKAGDNSIERQKKDKDLVPISDDEIPFKISKSWKWVRLNEVSNINGGYAFKSQNFKDIGVRVIKISDFDEDGLKDNKIVRHKYDPTLSQFEINNENILLCMTGGTVGKSYFVKNISEKMVTNQRVATIKINHCLIPEYINYVILSPYIQKIISERKNSTNDNISMDDIKSFVIPLAPFAEQKRIVKKVEEVMKLVAQLREAFGEGKASGRGRPKK